MLKGLLDVATVQEGDGNWTAGYSFEALGGAIGLFGTVICTPVRTLEAGSIGASGNNAGGASGGNPYAFRGLVAAVELWMRRPIHCASGEELQYLETLIRAASDRAAAYFLWNGFPTTPTAPDTNTDDYPSLQNTYVSTASAGSSTKAALENVAAKFFSITAAIDGDPIVHLGTTSAIELAALSMFDEPGGMIAGLNLPYVVSPSYPATGVAMTGPVDVKLGTPQGLRAVDRTINRDEISANRLIGVDFDPYTAVRAT